MLLSTPHTARALRIIYLNAFSETRKAETTSGAGFTAEERSPVGVCHSRLAAEATFNKGGETERSEEARKEERRREREHGRGRKSESR